MKILYYSPHPNLNLASPAGYGTHMRGTIEALKELGHEVKLVIKGGEPFQATNNRKFNLKYRITSILPNYIKQSVKDYLMLKRDKTELTTLNNTITEFQPDLIYERSAYLMSAGVRLSKALHIPHYLEINAPFLQEKKEMEGNSFFLSRAKVLEALKVRFSSNIIVVSSALKQHVAKDYAVPESKVKVIPNGINPNDWAIVEDEVVALKEACGVSDSDVVIGFVGSILPHHGVERLINGFAKVKEDNWKLLIVGGGETLEQLKQRVEILNIQNQVLFTDNVPFSAVKNYMSLFTVAVMPQSNWYGSPVKLFEYGMMKKPVIAPEVKPVMDVMKSDEDGILVANELALSEALKFMVKHKHKAREMAEHWHRRVIGNYTWKKLVDKTLNS